jgi:hypothetical protein
MAEGLKVVDADAAGILSLFSSGAFRFAKISKIPQHYYKVRGSSAVTQNG